MAGFKQSDIIMYPFDLAKEDYKRVYNQENIEKFRNRYRPQDHNAIMPFLHDSPALRVAVPMSKAAPKQAAPAPAVNSRSNRTLT